MIHYFEHMWERMDSIIKLCECPISNEVIKNPVFFTCGHVFNKESLLSTLNKCPIC